jgi:hypothetical protein
VKVGGGCGHHSKQGQAVQRWQGMLVYTCVWLLSAATHLVFWLLQDQVEPCPLCMG